MPALSFETEQCESASEDEAPTAMDEDPAEHGVDSEHGVDAEYDAFKSYAHAMRVWYPEEWWLGHIALGSIVD